MEDAVERIAAIDGRLFVADDASGSNKGVRIVEMQMR
jgi:hypothetical protein